jgi:hypothetical protein
MLAPLFSFTNMTLRYDHGPVFRIFHEFALNESSSRKINGPDLSWAQRLRLNHDFVIREFSELLPLISQITKCQNFGAFNLTILILPRYDGSDRVGVSCNTNSKYSSLLFSQSPKCRNMDTPSPQINGPN